MRNTRTTAAAVLIGREVLKMYAVQIVRSCPIYTYRHSDKFRSQWGVLTCAKRPETVSVSLSFITSLLRKGKKKKRKKKDICRLIQLIYLLFCSITAEAGRRISTQLAKWLLLKAEGSHAEFVNHFPHIECLFTISDQFWQMTKECQCGHFEF